MTVVITEAPTGTAIPLVLDSPHSGTDYPADFGTVADPETLRTCEDTHVHDLVRGGLGLGAVLVHAQFPRSYIDANRAVDDIDPELLDEPWPGPLAPGQKSRLGLGLIRRLCAPGMPMYDRKLSVAEVQGRIDRCYQPYHAAVADALDRTHQRFGRVFHIDCHSMKSLGNEMGTDPGAARPDFCISDQHGRTSDPAFPKLVADHLTALGYEARINDPYQGAELVRRYGRPAENRHSIQIEIKRSLYMDERSRVPNDGYGRVKADLTATLAAVRTWILSR